MKIKWMSFPFSRGVCLEISRIQILLHGWNYRYFKSWIKVDWMTALLDFINFFPCSRISEEISCSSPHPGLYEMERKNRKCVYKAWYNWPCHGDFTWLPLHIIRIKITRIILTFGCFGFILFRVSRARWTVRCGIKNW